MNRTKCLIPAFGLLLLTGCGENGSADRCLDVVCNHPPASDCKDPATRLVYQTPGDCDETSGECLYPSQEEACDDPPEDSCLDEDSLTIYQPAGSCSGGWCQYDSYQQDCPYGCLAGRCQQSPSGDFELVVPPGTRLCSTFAESDDCARCTWEAKSRIGLLGGTYSLPLDQDQFELDWVLGVELAPWGEAAVPAGAGTVTRTVEGTSYHYEYRQTWLLDSSEHPMVMRLDFSRDAPVLTLDTPTVNQSGRFSGSVNVTYQSPSLISCDTSTLLAQERTIDVSNGDRLWLSFRGWQVEHGYPFPSMTFRGEIVEARFTRNGQERVVDDFFNLAATLNHHGPIPAYWIVLEEPLEGIRYLHIDEFSYGDNLMYLDADEQEIESQPY